jgi:Protein of unknown function (DUF3592)
MKNRILINFMGITFATIGAFFVAHGIQERLKGKESLSWPTTRGVIIEAEVHRSEGNSKSRPTYSPRVQYSYAVDGTEYMGKRIRFAAIGSGDRSEAAAVVKKYAPSTSVEVAYKPDKPSESVLEPGQFGRSFGLILAGFVFMGFGIPVIIYQKQLLERIPNK